VKEALSRRLGVSAARQGGLVGYRESIEWEAGGIVAWTEGRDDCLASLNGDSLAGLDLAAQFELFKELYALGGKTTRIDVAFDEFTRELFSIGDVHAAANAGNFAGFRVFADGSDKALINDGQIVRTSDAMTFGRKGKVGGGRQVIFYDKTLQSGGVVDALRIEARFMKAYAGVVGTVLADKDDCAEFERELQRLVGGSIDFVDRAGANGHRDRMTRLTWWEKVVSVLGEARVRAERVCPPLQSTVEYFKDAYCKTYAALSRKIREAGHDPVFVLNTVTRQMVREGEVRLEDSGLPNCKDLAIDLKRIVGPCERPPRRGRRK
jgi:hypothetical protein